MTTSHERLREAADIVGFVGAKDSYIDWAVSDKQRAAFQLAANTLRVIASAQSDAEKGYKSWFFENIRATEGVHVNSDGSTMMRSELIDQGYHAGHAQGYAAGLAALEAKCAELERELRMYRDCADEEDEQQYASDSERVKGIREARLAKELREPIVDARNQDWD